jgi:hypothetical protein
MGDLSVVQELEDDENSPRKDLVIFTEEAKLYEMNQNQKPLLPGPYSPGIKIDTYGATNDIDCLLPKKEFRILIAEDSTIHRNNLQHILSNELNLDESYVTFVGDG